MVSVRPASVRRTVLVSIVSAIALALLLPALAALASADGRRFGPPAAGEAPDPGEALAQMAFFVGEWQCTGRDSTPEGTSYPVVADARVEFTADGSWLSFTLAERATPENPEPLSGVWLWGHESEAPRYSAFFFDSLGNRTEQYAPGWREDRLLFEGRIVGPGFEAPYRDIVTRHSDTAFTVSGQGYLFGEWLTFQRLDCARDRAAQAPAG